MAKKKEFSEKEIARREADLIACVDAKNLGDLRNRQPDIVGKVEALLEVGHTVDMIGRVFRGPNPQMWVESKYVESVARALIAEAE